MRHVSQSILKKLLYFSGVQSHFGLHLGAAIINHKYSACVVLLLKSKADTFQHLDTNG